MPKKRHKERIEGSYFGWLLGQRNGVWQADGRSNRPSAGRHSLGTRARSEAVRRTHELDRQKAVEFGLAYRSILAEAPAALVPLDEGRKLYLNHKSRPPVLGGAAPRTLARYRAVFDKFSRFAEKHDDEDYAGRTRYLELTTIKQVVKWLVRERLLPNSCLLTMKVKKVQGTDAYCDSTEEVRAILRYCREREALGWLRDVVTGLATTGLRIGELADLRWTNVDLSRGMLHLRDTSRQARKSERKRQGLPP